MTTTERLIFTDLENNNNKWWNGEWANNTVKVNFGRVGDKIGQSKTHVLLNDFEAKKKFDSLIREKLRKGYTRQLTMTDISTNVAFVAKVQIKHNNDPETSALIDFLIKRNIHAIEGTTSIRLEAGRLTTPLGPVTPEGLDQAEVLLNRMAIDISDLPNLANLYMRIVPRDIGRRKVKTDPMMLFGSVEKLQAEQALVDSLRAVVKDIEQKASNDGPPVFQTQLSILDATAGDFSHINKTFLSTMNSRHQSYSYRLYRVWEMRIQSMDERFDKAIGNVKRLWHGTRDANLLSILKNGYIIPKQGGSVVITGRMFGDGIYFSDQSTKSLNYCIGQAPGQYGRDSSARVFMLLNDVAMGKEYMPSSGYGFNGRLPQGYNSCFAKAGYAGVMNNEQIVYDVRQVKPVYLCEFRNG